MAWLKGAIPRPQGTIYEIGNAPTRLEPARYYETGKPMSMRFMSRSQTWERLFLPPHLSFCLPKRTHVFPWERSFDVFAGLE
jgi:hypothetical protein